MIDLNRRAFVDIKSQRFQAARYWLAEALVISETDGLENHEMTARTYVHLAVVSLSGLKDREEATRQFMLALKINPDITITPGLETPALKSAYLEARERLELPPNPDPTATARTEAAKPAPAEPIGVRIPRLDHDSGTPSAWDPDLPARVSAPLYCPVPFEVPRGKDLLVRCVTQRQQKRASATLYYRPDGTLARYTALPMSRSPKGWLVAIIPASELGGRSLSYYVKAQATGAQPPVFSGYPETPNALLIKGEPPSESPTTAAEKPGPANGKSWHRRPPGSLWAGLAFGAGTVYHGREPVDSNTTTPLSGQPVYVEAGFSPAVLFHIEPELGYQWGERFSLALMLRYQYAPADSGGAAPTAGERAVLTSALAGFLRAQVFFGSSGSFQPYASLGAGYGQSFLAVVSKRCAPDQCALDHSDTVHGGPWGLLASLGLLYNFTPTFGITADLKEIVVVPKVMALTEFNLGLAVAHDFGAKAAPARAMRTSPLATP